MISFPSPRALLLAATLFSAGCATATSEAPAACPPWPVAGPAVAAELAALPAERHPALFDWIERLARLRDQLRVSR